MKTLISVIIPVFNEEKAIAGVIEAIKEAMQEKKLNYEVIIVDDASTDETHNIVSKLNVKVITHKHKKGSGASRKTGILNADGEIIVMIDGDGSYEPKDIPKIIEKMNDSDQVIGKRKKEKGTFRFLRAPVKWLIVKLAESLSGSHIPDLNSGIRAFKKDTMKKFLWVIPDGFSCVSTMTLAFLCNGYSVSWVDTDYYSRIGKSKFHPIKDTYSYILTVLRIIMYFNPIRIFFPLGLLTFIAGMGRGIYDRYYSESLTLQEADIILIVVSIIIIVLGLLADLIVAQTRARIYN